MNLKALAKDTAVYGLSSIIGRFLNYLLVPLYTTKIAAESGGYGVVTNLYAYTALLLAVLTFGMETTLFRFSNKEGEDPDKVYGTILRLVGGVGLVFLALVFCFLGPVSEWMGYASRPEYVGCMAVIVAMDAFQAIMFSRLRQQGKSLKFAVLKFAFIIPNILLNLFVFLLMPRIPGLSALYGKFDSGVGLIFFVNFICTAGVFLLFGKELKGLGYGFDSALAGRLLKYSWPLLLLSLVGILNQVADKILFPFLVPGEEGKVQLGIYGACVKIAMILSLLTQAFRYAYEPIVFNSRRGSDSDSALADGMKYFIVFSLLAFLAVLFYMPLLRHFIGRSYWEGLGVVPVVMLAEIFMGIYFNLSFWYKLSDKTWWGAIISFTGALVMIAVNIILVPRIGYWGCAWGGFAGYLTAMLMSFFIGRRKAPVSYDFKSIGAFVTAAVSMVVIHLFVSMRIPLAAGLALDTLLLLVFGFVIIKHIKSTVI